MLVTLQEIYFDLCDLRDIIDAGIVPNISLRQQFDLEVHDNLREFVSDQIEKLEPFTIEGE